MYIWNVYEIAAISGESPSNTTNLLGQFLNPEEAWNFVFNHEKIVTKEHIIFLFKNMCPKDISNTISSYLNLFPNSTCKHENNPENIDEFFNKDGDCMTVYAMCHCAERKFVEISSKQYKNNCTWARKFICIKRSSSQNNIK